MNLTNREAQLLEILVVAKAEADKRDHAYGLEQCFDTINAAGVELGIHAIPEMSDKE